MSLKTVKARLDAEVLKRDSLQELTLEKPDPLYIAKQYNDETVALICALFAYGNAKAIVTFLNTLKFSLLNESEKTIREVLKHSYYRFQKSEDVIALFIALKRLREKKSLEELFYSGYKQDANILEGLSRLIGAIKEAYVYESRGYKFLIGAQPNPRTTSPYKRYLMYLRWMVREDNLDMGLWKSVDKKDLLIPLDTHTFHVARKLGLLKRKSYDFKAVLELTERLKKFDKNDPVKYDFALYRLGQERIV
jgi:uncharacterized protein (TIGR02757 family)